MGRALDVRVVAEGIERADPGAAAARARAATIGQGYLYGRPVPLPEVLYLLSSRVTRGRRWPAIRSDRPGALQRLCRLQLPRRITYGDVTVS